MKKLAIIILLITLIIPILTYSESNFKTEIKQTVKLKYSVELKKIVYVISTEIWVIKSKIVINSLPYWETRICNKDEVEKYKKIEYDKAIKVKKELDECLEDEK